jgi:hypothetical protein
MNAMLLNAQGVRRLLISPHCKHLIKALDCLTYKEGSKIPDTKSGLDHITDALGYLVMGVFPIVKDGVSFSRSKSRVDEPEASLGMPGVKNVSDNVGSVKRFSSVGRHALGEERHCAPALRSPDDTKARAGRGSTPGWVVSRCTTGQFASCSTASATLRSSSSAGQNDLYNSLS